ncbi:MAG: tetratricopeptide repeat protein [Candidatus Aureabacteria bacterium]|nr:tetratricopeptide repeat protein [Candidatus Auribacterota bacterium]
MRRNAVIAILAVLLTLPCAGSVAKTNLRLERPKAKPREADFEEKRTPEDTIDLIICKLEEDPYNCEHYKNLAIIFQRMENYEMMLKSLEYTVAYLPDDYKDKDVIYGRLALAYLLNDRIVEARIWINRADEVNPNNIDNRWLSVCCNILRLNYKETACELKKVNELLDDESEKDMYHYAYWYASEVSSDKDHIIKIFQEVVKLEPDNAKGYRALATAVRNSDLPNIKKNFDLIMSCYNKSIELDSDYILTYVSAANFYMLLYKKYGEKAYYEKALEYFQKGYEIHSESERLAYAEGVFHFYTGNNDKAIECLEFAYEKGICVHDTLSLAYNAKAYNYYKSGENLEEGLKLIELAIALSPDNGIIIGTKAELLYKTGRYEEAYQCIKKAIELEPDEKEIQEDLVMIEEALSKKGRKNYDGR